MSGALKLTGKDMLRLFHRHGEGYKRRRNVDFLEGTAHGILSADRRRAKLHLRFECAEQSGERFAPAAAVAHGFFKIFLEGQIDVLEFRPTQSALRWIPQRPDTRRDTGSFPKSSDYSPTP